MMKKLIFDTAKEAFRRGYRKYKRGQRKTERVPYDLVKSDIKRSIRGTKFTSKAEIKATPGAKRRIILRIEKAKRNKKKFKSPVIYGKAYASDKKGKTMQVQPLTFEQRKLMKKEMRQAAIDQYNKQFLSKKKKGGVAGLLLGGLLTSGIKTAAKKLFKSGTRKTQQIVKESGVTRDQAKSDVKFAIRNELKGKLSKKDVSLSSPFYNKKLRRMLIRDINKLK